MTPERLQALTEFGFKWSAPTPSRKSKDGAVENAADTANEQQPVVKKEETDSEGATKEPEATPAEPPMNADTCIEV
jgi:hypothetical protein